MATDLPTIAKAIRDVLSPHVDATTRPANALYPRPAWTQKKSAAPAPVSAPSGAAVAVSSPPLAGAPLADPAAPAAPARRPRGEARRDVRLHGVLSVEMPGIVDGPIVVNLAPMPRLTPAQQAAVTKRAQDALALAVAKAAEMMAPGSPTPEIHVAMRDRVVASTDPSKIVSVRPEHPSIGGQVATVLADGTVVLPGGAKFSADIPAHPAAPVPGVGGRPAGAHKPA